MKNLVKLFTVIALLAIGFSASAQTEKDPTIMHNGSTRMFSITPHENSKYAWTVEKDGTTAVDASILSGISSNALTVNWSEIGKYKVTVIESSIANCTASDVNTKVYWVDVQANDFSVVPTWDLKVNDQLSACAISGANVVRFILTKKNGKIGAWKYSYRIDKSYTDGTPGSVGSVISGTVSAAPDGTFPTTYIIDFSSTVDTGAGDCIFTFELLDARDDYNTPNSNLADDNVVTATVHKLPATGDITID